MNMGEKIGIIVFLIAILLVILVVKREVDMEYKIQVNNKIRTVDHCSSYSGTLEYYVGSYKTQLNCTNCSCIRFRRAYED